MPMGGALSGLHMQGLHSLISATLNSRPFHPPHPQECLRATRATPKNCPRVWTCGRRVGFPLPRGRHPAQHQQSSTRQNCSCIAPRRRRVRTEPKSICTDGPSVAWVRTLASFSLHALAHQHDTTPSPPPASLAQPPPSPSAQVVAPSSSSSGSKSSILTEKRPRRYVCTASAGRHYAQLILKRKMPSTAQSTPPRPGPEAFPSPLTRKECSVCEAPRVPLWQLNKLRTNLCPRVIDVQFLLLPADAEP